MSDQLVNLKPEIKDLLKLLEERVGSRLAISPYLKLNYLWPSLGVIDRYAFFLRGKSLLTDLEKKVYNCISAYISVIITSIWKDLDIMSEVTLDEESKVCINLKYNEKLILLPIEQLTFDFFSKFNGQLVLDKNTTRPYSVSSNILSMFVYGLLIAHSPAFKNSPWITESESERVLRTEKISRIIASQTAKWFKQVVPDLELSHVPELYLNGLHNPKFLLEDGAPFLDGINTFFKYCDQFKIPLSYLRNMAEAFSLCPDEQLGLYSVALSGLFVNQNVPQSLLSSADIYSYGAPFLRLALGRSLSKVNHNEDWVGTARSDNAKKRYELEVLLNCHPWISISYKRLSDPKLSSLIDFFAKVSFYDFSQSYRELEKLIEITPSDIELRIQQIKLEAVRGDFEKAHDLAKQLISEPEADKYPDFFNLWGECLVKLEEPQLAKRYFKIASDNGNLSKHSRAEILNNLAWALVMIEENEEAKNYLIEAEALSLSPLKIYLNLAFVYFRLKEVEKGVEYVHKATSIAPLDYRVISTLVGP